MVHYQALLTTLKGDQAGNPEATINHNGSTQWVPEFKKIFEVLKIFSQKRHYVLKDTVRIPEPQT